MLVSMGQIAKLAAQCFKAVLHLVRQRAMGDRHAVVRRHRERQAQRRSRRSDVARGDLEQVVVFALQPEDRHHRFIDFVAERARQPYGRRCLV